MCISHHDVLWRNFPKTAIEFETRFPNEEACRHYFAELRWNGSPACAKCDSERVWCLNGRACFECADCGHQTSLTSGTLLHGTRKPLRMWFRAILEMTIRKNGISAKDLQRIMGFGSYETAWVWLHKLRRGLVRENREPMGDVVQLDETLIGGEGGEKALVFVAAEVGGRVRLAHTPNNDEDCIKMFADSEIAGDAGVATDGLPSYNERSLENRPHEMTVQSNDERAQKDALQFCHWAALLAKRWLLGTHHGAVRPKHLQSYLDEYSFRHNRRETKGPARLAARVLEGLVVAPPMTMRQLVDDTLECRLFVQAELQA